MSARQPVYRVIAEHRLTAVERELESLRAEVEQLIRTVREVRIEEQMVAEDCLKLADSVRALKLRGGNSDEEGSQIEKKDGAEVPVLRRPAALCKVRKMRSVL